MLSSSTSEDQSFGSMLPDLPSISTNAFLQGCVDFAYNEYIVPKTQGHVNLATGTWNQKLFWSSCCQ